MITMTLMSLSPEAAKTIHADAPSALGVRCLLSVTFFRAQAAESTQTGCWKQKEMRGSPTHTHNPNTTLWPLLMVLSFSLQQALLNSMALGPERHHPTSSHSLLESSSQHSLMYPIPWEEPEMVSPTKIKTKWNVFRTSEESKLLQALTP